MRSRRRDRPCAKAVIAAEHQRNRAFFNRRARGLVDAIAYLGDLFDEFLFGITVLLGFGNRRREIAAVDDDPSERGDLFAETRDAKCRWSHIDTATAAAHVEWNADQMNGGGHGRTIQKQEARRIGESLLNRVLLSS